MSSAITEEGFDGNMTVKIFSGRFSFFEADSVFFSYSLSSSFRHSFVLIVHLN